MTVKQLYWAKYIEERELKLAELHSAEDQGILNFQYRLFRNFQCLVQSTRCLVWRLAL